MWYLYPVLWFALVPFFIVHTGYLCEIGNVGCRVDVDTYIIHTYVDIVFIVLYLGDTKFGHPIFLLESEESINVRVSI